MKMRLEVGISFYYGRSWYEVYRLPRDQASGTGKFTTNPHQGAELRIRMTGFSTCRKYCLSSAQRLGQ